MLFSVIGPRNWLKNRTSSIFHPSLPLFSGQFTMQSTLDRKLL